MENFVISKDGKTVEKYTGSEKNVAVPIGIEVIGNEAFRMSKVETVLLPDGVKKIESCAFYGCMSLKKINIPDSIEFIGVSAFEQCLHLKELQLPDKKISFAEASFRNTYFDSFVLPEETEEIRNNMFNGSMCFTQMVIPGNVESIGQYSFGYCTSLKKVVIKNGVKSVMHRAFYKAPSLAEVHIPASVEILGQQAFEFCECLSDVYVDWREFPTAISQNDKLFTGVYLRAVTLHVPEGTLSKYKDHPSFSRFGKIEEKS